MIKISVIILNLNDPITTIHCIDSIYEHTKGITFEVILIDNGSKDNSYQLFEKQLQNRKNLTIIYSPTNLGFGKGNNVGAKKARGNYLFFLNNDTLLYENSLKKIVSEFESFAKKDHIGFLQPRLYNNKEKTKVQQTATAIPNFFQILQENFKILQKIQSQSFAGFRYLDWDRNSPRQVDCVCGAAFLVKKSDFKKMGLFDEQFKIYFEEYDLGRRSKQLGFRNFYTTKTSIIHLLSRWPAPYFYKKWIYTQSFIKYLLKYL